MSEKMYLKIYEEIRRSIIDGAYKMGEKIPSKRQCAENYGVSVITVEHAYELLFEEGYITSREKKGYFVSFDEADSFSGILEKEVHFRHQNENHGISASADMQITNNSKKATNSYVTSGQAVSLTDTEGFSPSIYARTARQVLSNYPDLFMKKSPNCGTEYLRNTLAKYLKRSRGMSVNCENIIIGAGAEYLYGLIFQTLGKDRIFGIEAPSYYKIEQIYTALGANYRQLKLGKDGISSKDLRETNADVLHISPYRSYPSGVTASAAKKREYLKWASDRKGLLIEDDFESEFTPSRKPEETVFSLDTEGNVIYVNTFTRTVSPSIRIAYMVVPDRLRGEFEEKIGFYSCTVSTFEQYILAGIIENGDFERHLNRVRRNHRRNLLSSGKK